MSCAGWLRGHFLSFHGLYHPRLVSVEAPQKQWCVHHLFYSSSHGQGTSFIKHCVAQRMTVENKVGKTCGAEQMESSLMVSLGLKGISINMCHCTILLSKYKRITLKYADFCGCALHPRILLCSCCFNEWHWGLLCCFISLLKMTCTSPGRAQLRAV